ncbi:uncharacterized protein LOC144357179 [Saccoglossus kowalevskii]
MSSFLIQFLLTSMVADLSLETTTVPPVSVTPSCGMDNGGCEHQCQLTNGLETCSCDTGYVLNEDEKTCFDLGCQMEISVKYPTNIVSNKLAEFDISSAAGCCIECGLHPECTVWTWLTLTTKCFLKKGDLVGISGDNVFSGRPNGTAPTVGPTTQPFITTVNERTTVPPIESITPDMTSGTLYLTTTQQPISPTKSKSFLGMSTGGTVMFSLCLAITILVVGVCIVLDLFYLSIGFLRSRKDRVLKYPTTNTM